MKKTAYIIFIGAFLVLCLIPLVCMIFARSDKQIGNEMLVSAPSFTDEEKHFNYEILDDTGTWFERHFAFRPQMITADAKIQEAVFKVSNTDSVVTGKDGWLYYSSTLDDYLGRNTLSERGMWNAAHNLSLLQNYVEANGAKFLFMVPPNKNSLYGGSMPYYYVCPDGAAHNRDRINETLKAAGVSYLDLFALYEEQDETLYLKQDSHWNNKGALMVYNAALSALDQPHETFSSVEVTKAETHAGDLAAMIYPASDEKEYDYTYNYEPGFVYLDENSQPSEQVTVEDSHIRTLKGSAKGSLLMYRDSFGNTLVPFMAEAYGSAHFSKAAPYNLAADMEAGHPDQVIFEKVERNYPDFAKDPGVIPSPVRSEGQEGLSLLKDVSLSAEPCLTNMTFVSFKGEIPEQNGNPEGRFYLGVKDASGSEMVYEMFTVCTENSDYGFLAYLPLARFGSIDNIDINSFSVYTDAAA